MVGVRVGLEDEQEIDKEAKTPAQGQGRLRDTCRTLGVDGRR